MYPGDAAQRYHPAYLEAASRQAEQDARHHRHHRPCSKDPPGPGPRGGGFSGYGPPGAPFLRPPGPLPGTVDEYTATMAKSYQEYASAMMKPEYAAQWGQLASKFWQGQYPGGPPPMAGYPPPGPPPGAGGPSAGPRDPASMDKSYMGSLKYWPGDAKARAGEPRDPRRDEVKREEGAGPEQPEGAAGAADRSHAHLSKREREARQAKRLADRPVVSPFQRNAVFGVDGMLVTGNARKKAGARSKNARKAVDKPTADDEAPPASGSGGGAAKPGGRDVSAPSTRSTDTGPEESRDTSNNTAWRGKGAPPAGAGAHGALADPRAQQQRLYPYPYMHPALTKSVLGEASYHSVRGLIMQQQGSFAQQVRELHRVVDLQAKLTGRGAARPPKEEISPSNTPAGAQGGGGDGEEAPRAAKGLARAPREAGAGGAGGQARSGVSLGRHLATPSRLRHPTVSPGRSRPAPGGADGELDEPARELPKASGKRGTGVTAEEGEEGGGVAVGGPSKAHKASHGGKREPRSPIEEGSDSEKPGGRRSAARLGDRGAGFPPGGYGDYLAHGAGPGRDYGRDYAAAAAASYSYQAMLHQMAAAGGAMGRMPVPPGGGGGGMQYGASPYTAAMDYYAAMQNPAWYSAYAAGVPGLPPPPKPEYP